MGNDKKILNVKEIHSKKLKELQLVAGLKSHNSDKVIANFHPTIGWTMRKYFLSKV